MAVESTKSFNSIFCPPSPGRPGPRPIDGGPRLRVTLSPQKGESCGYYALQILRDELRIGKTPLESQLKDREIEKIISNHRKEATKLNAQFEPAIDLEAQLSQDLSRPCTKRDARDFLDNHFSKVFSEHKEVLRKILQSFCAQDTHEVFLKYIQETYGTAMQQVDSQLFQQLNVPTAFIERPVTKNSLQWANMTTWQKACHMRQKVFEVSYLNYGCKRSTWHPEQTIDRLIEQLAHGPHLVLGNIGKDCYYQEPDTLPQKVEGRSILYWKPSSPRKESVNFHAVVIIGADLEKKRVYFLDPRDGSKPGNLSTQKIYAMSYERLKTSICSLQRIQSKPGRPGGPVFLPQKQGPNDYALHM